LRNSKTRGKHVLLTKVDIKNMVWKPTFGVIVSDCALKSFVFGTRIPKSNF